jgi:predicted nucleic acid-binding Zn ribbon protein
MEHLDDPVQEYIPLIRMSQTFTISSLPRGKYIVCGEALDKMGDVYQESCLETRIRKRKSKGLQSGVQALIVISMVMVSAGIVYALLLHICKKVCGSPPAKN